jgi:NosR/NirI family transcriptional regulator, nitrous oxide reductase regulator
MKKNCLIIILFISVVMVQATVVQRFPKPDFESHYIQPEPTMPAPRSLLHEYTDILVLIVALSIVTFMVLKKRSRLAILAMMIFSLLYFGFWRNGCICPVGSVQNVTMALFDGTYIIPISALAFFLLPLVFTLFFGRTFCAGVCPLGAIQDLVVIKPLHLPRWISNILEIFPYIYLAFAVLFAAAGAGFIICRYDPFVGIFRFNAQFKLFVLGACILIIGFFIARPYCRFICPYSVLLNWMSAFSRRHLSITPDKCIQCRLCEESCPFDAIRIPPAEPVIIDRTRTRKRLMLLILLSPFIIFISAWLMSRSSDIFARVHPTVRLAERIRLEDSGQADDTVLESRTFRASGKPTEQLFQEAFQVRKKIKTGSAFLGAFIALVFIIKLIHFSIYRRQIDYEPDRGQCLSCGRCISYCPQEHVRLGLISEQS